MSTWLVVGLGNPGPDYANHRHSVGRMVVDELARREQVTFSAARLKRYDSASFPLGADKVVLLKSRTYMNESGIAVAKALNYLKLKPEQLIVIHDELDLDLGQLRLKLGGGDNGHNGLKSIRAHLHTGDFYRVRFGIGRPPGRQDPAAFVLRPFSAKERQTLPIDIDNAADAVHDLIVGGLAQAQNAHNS
ncbi:MAG: aminoacyl-tRNA hydrolase [Propionibacteriaceae bacterium]|jgi:PTH1 family peptidyl-tRNA hydrolase|nr:aminoacyl-tRNA hydrolase [Propionibacteriaceae bacterium]